MDVVKVSIRACEAREWSDGVMMNLRALAL